MRITELNYITERPLCLGVNKMSKKWNDPEARDNYILLITLDNIIFFFLFMYLNYKFTAAFLSGDFLEYSIYNLKVLFIIRFICILICSYNASKILFSMVEMYRAYDKPYRDFDDYKFKNKFSYFRFFKTSLIGIEKKQCIKAVIYSMLWIVLTVVLSTRDFASYGSKNSFQQILCLSEISSDIENNNIVEYDIEDPTVYKSSNGLRYIIPIYDNYNTELVLTDRQYDMLKSGEYSYHVTYYELSGFVISISNNID